MKLTGQKKQVYDYIKSNPGCTVREIHRNVFPGVDKVSARLSEIERLGVKIKRLGRNKHREMQYAVEQPFTKIISTFEIRDGVAYEIKKEVEV